MMRLTHRLNTTLSDSLRPIAIHIGINSGRALVGSTKFEGQDRTQWTYTASGLVTIVAARLMALAQAGMILIGPETAQRVSGIFFLQDMGEQQLKNLRQKVSVYQVLQVLPEA
jgi:class 3 adenylate cyclase